MDARFSSVKILIWDFDGTLYPDHAQLRRDIRQAEYRTIMNHTKWSAEKTAEEFAKLHLKRYPSATETIAALCNISIRETAVEMEQYFDRTKYLARDEKLIHLFGKLKKFRHFMLANGVAANHQKALEVLGIPVRNFEEMVTAEIVGNVKPHPEGFLYILHKTQLPPNQHLMIGDREIVDLAPAKKLGMHACLVWSKMPSTIADATVPTVYDVAHLLR